MIVMINWKILSDEEKKNIRSIYEKVRPGPSADTLKKLFGKDNLRGGYNEKCVERIKKTPVDKIAETLENNGFRTTFDEGQNILTIHRYSPAGQDFSFDVQLNSEDDIQDVAGKIREYHEAYDPSYEASLWLDETGHGRNGAPYDMKDLYEDMVACKEYIHEAARLVDDIGKVYLQPILNGTDETPGELPSFGVFTDANEIDECMQYLGYDPDEYHVERFRPVDIEEPTVLDGKWKNLS